MRDSVFTVLSSTTLKQEAFERTHFSSLYDGRALLLRKSFPTCLQQYLRLNINEVKMY